MVRRRVWFERDFTVGLPVEAFPDILERLRGTPARLEERVRGIPTDVLTRHDGDAWSAQENVGHLLDLEALWLARVDDLAAGRTTLTAADLTNRTTHEAGHDARPIPELLAAFRAARGDLVARLEQLTDEGLMRTALHPRLNQPMSVVDHAFFVAEHDDHHLARIGELVRLNYAQRADRARAREPDPPAGGLRGVSPSVINTANNGEDTMPRDNLGEFEQRVLLTLLRLGNDAYTVPIVRELEARTGREVAAAAVYIALRRLEERGLVRSELRDPGAEGGRNRRHFLLTEDARAQLRQAHRTYMRLSEGLAPLLEDG